MSSPLRRARTALARPGAWIEARDGRYAVRTVEDRRARPLLILDEAAFRSLIDVPGLRGRPGGGWVARDARVDRMTPPAGRPGTLEGARVVIEPDGRTLMRRANLGESPLAWLARRRDAEGQPWISAAEAAAGERLRAEAEIALAGPSLTMRWDALPRSGGGSAARVEPGDRALAASRRVAAALEACPPAARAFVEHICIRGVGLQDAEADFGLRRREGKRRLRQGLAALAAHYRIG